MSTFADLAWFREAKLGVFLHWVAHAAVRPGDPVTPGHVFNTPFAQYRFLLDRFALEGFDAETFVARIKALGARYLIPTSHHADGLCLWDTATTDFKLTNAPARLDVVGALAKACRRHGIKFGLYFPYSDMSHPLMQPLFAHGKQDSAGWGDDCPLTPDQLAEYRGHLKTQIRELCTQYGEIVILWWDGGPTDRGWVREVKQMVYDLQPGIIQNSRFSGGLWRGVGEPLCGDFFTPEQTVPSVPLMHDGKPVPFETCLVSTGNWLYDRTERNFKRDRTLVRDLLEAVSKGGNLLLNMAPDEHGRVNPEVDQALDEMGDWLRRHGEAVWGTEAGPRHDVPDAALTRRGHSLYVHYYGTAGRLALPDFGIQLIEARALESGELIPARTAPDGTILLDLSHLHLDDIATVLRLDFDGVPTCTVSPAPVPNDFILPCGRTENPPTESDWAHATAVAVTEENGHNRLVWRYDADELSFEVKVLNDDTCLYFRVAVHQRDLAETAPAQRVHDAFAEAHGMTEAARMLNRASVEIFLDALPASPEVTADGRCCQLVVSAAGKAEVAFASPDAVPFASRAERTDTGYTVWFTVPFTSLLKDAARPRPDYNLLNFFGLPRKDIPFSASVKPVRPGDVIGVNVSVNAPHVADGVQTKRKLWWQARSHCPFNDPHQWGRLRLAPGGNRLAKD